MGKINKTLNIPYGRQCIEEDDINAVVSILRSDFLTTGPTINAFEDALKKTTDAKHVVVCANGTAALHLALMSLGVGNGDKVIVPSMTFVATANVVRLTGAEVIFSDVNPQTGLMEPGHMEKVLSKENVKDIKAVIPVHLNGQCTEMPAIHELAEENGIRILEDACHALGSTYTTINNDTIKTGACLHSDLCTFSFHPVKSITTGEGGAVTTNNEKLYKKTVRLRNHGLVNDNKKFKCDENAMDQNGNMNPWYYECQQIGLNYRISDIQCALGISQLGKLERFLQERKKLSTLYNKLIKPLAPVIVPVTPVDYCQSAWHLYAVLVDFYQLEITRAELMSRLKEMGIGTQVHYIPLHKHPYYAERYKVNDLPGADAYYHSVLTLPLYPTMTRDDVQNVVYALNTIVNN